MNLYNNLLWMFFGSIIIGLFLNGMNILAYRFADIYFSLTLFYSATFMAINMCILELMMYYFHTRKIKLNLFLLFTILWIINIYLLRQQKFINDSQWLRRMISHHSTALLTSNKIKERTKDSKIKKLANEIIKSQEREIILMKNML